MDFLALAKHRFSCRKYQDKEINSDDIDYILEAGRVAPSAKNLQPWRFIVVKDPVILNHLSEAYARDWIKSAKAIIVIVVDHRESWVRGDQKDHGDIDAAIAIDHMTLAAQERGVGTCWVCNFNVEEVKDTLNIPVMLEPVALLPLGYPAEKGDSQRHQKQRKPLSEIVFNDKM